MLEKLRIQNYAIIDDAHIDFKDKLNIITGETGAGKSIVLGALSILLGDRFDKNALYSAEKKCIIEAEFDCSKLNIQSFFDKHDLDFETTSVIRREVNKSGKSRAFLNDTPVTLKTIREFATYLIDIHAQHDILDLKSTNYQLHQIDLFANQIKEVKAFGQLFDDYKIETDKLKNLIAEKEKGLAEQDYLSFLLTELEEANLTVGEEEDCLAKKTQMENSELISGNILKTNEALIEGSSNAISNIDASIDFLSEIEEYLPSNDNVIERLRSTNIELKDIAEEIQGMNGMDTINPNELLEIDARLQLIYGLEKKHQVSSIEELLSKQEELSEKIQSFLNIDEAIHTCQITIQKLKETLLSKGQALSSKRKSAAKKMENSINDTLGSIGMPFAIFKIRFSALTIDNVQKTGIDTIDFQLSPDKGTTYGPLNKIASGGELARIMLCLKSLVAASTAIPTLIFDEIDTGISGDIAGKVATLLDSISKEHQVILITHLPQIAAKGSHHMFVYKQMLDDKTVTNIKVLENKERIEEIATMLSGKNPTAKALDTAKELLNF